MAVVNGQPGFSQLTKLNVTDELLIRGSPAAIAPDEVLVASSDQTQDPGAVDTVIQVEFGPAQGTPDDPVQIDALGTVTFNQAGRYQATALFSFSRSTSAGESVLFVRALINGQQFRRPIGGRYDDDDNTIPSQFFANANINAGDTLTFEFYRDSIGINNGELTSEASSLGWGNSASASLVINKVA